MKLKKQYFSAEKWLHSSFERIRDWQLDNYKNVSIQQQNVVKPKLTLSSAVSTEWMHVTMASPIRKLGHMFIDSE